MNSEEAAKEIVNIFARNNLSPEQEDALNMAIDALVMKNKYSWIFRDTEPWHKESEKLNLVEEALDIRLFIWQRTFIYGHGYRQYGDTTARILKELLSEDKGPIIMYCLGAPMNGFYTEAMCEMKAKLDDFGIKTREIIKKRY